MDGLPGKNLTNMDDLGFSFLGHLDVILGYGSLNIVPCNLNIDRNNVLEY